jgi:hypothetical protein
MAHDAGGIEEHREALATALGMPHHPGAAVARLAALATGSGAQALARIVSCTAAFTA